MADKRYDEFPAGSAASTQLLLTGDPGTGQLGKITIGDLPGGTAPNLQDVTDIGNETTDTIFAASTSIAPSGGFNFNLDESGNYKANGWAGAIKQNSSTGHITLQSSIASGTAGGSPSYSGIPIDAAPNGDVSFGGKLQGSNYGTGAITGTPATRPVFDSSGNIVELVEPKRYVATLNQASTSAPVAQVMENTIGAIVWSRNGAGDYRGTLAGAFAGRSSGKVILFLNQVTFKATEGEAKLIIDSDDHVQIYTANTVGTVTDDILTSSSVQILIYP